MMDGQGMFLLTMTAAADGLHPAECGGGETCSKATSGQFAVLFMSFAFLVLGSAGIRPCSMPFGADQFDPHTESGKRGINSFFNWYYFTFTSAMLVSATVIIYVQSNVSWPIGHGIPTALLLLACVLVIVGPTCSGASTRRPSCPAPTTCAPGAPRRRTRGGCAACSRWRR